MIYLIHFNTAYHHARHYLGYSPHPEARVQQHLAGQGSPLVRAVVAAGISVRAWVIHRRGGRTLERQLKLQHNGRRFCPSCSGRRYIRQIV